MNLRNNQGQERPFPGLRTWFLATTLATAAWAGVPSADDFLAPLTSGPETRTAAAAVPTTPEQLTSKGAKTPVFAAPTADAGIAAASKTLLEGNGQVAAVRFESGIGIVARGTARYKAFPNRNASLYSKREAYLDAYLQAKANMASLLFSLDVKASQEVVRAVETYDKGDREALANTGSVRKETQAQHLEGLLRGAVVYAVKDNPEKQEVSVTIVTTPKTQGRTMEAGGSLLLAESARDGMDRMVAELRSGVIPPVGCRVISVPTPGGKPDLWFLGFGSAISPDNKNPEVKDELRRAAKREAEMKAASSLCGLLSGDQVSWASGFSSRQSEEMRQFDRRRKMSALLNPLKLLPSSLPAATEEGKLPAGNGPAAPGDADQASRHYPAAEINPEDEASYKIVPLDTTRRDFIRSTSSSDTYRSAQQGRLPPGLVTRSWESEDGDWIFAACVFHPSLSAQAAQLAKEMADTPSILDRTGFGENQDGTIKLQPGGKAQGVPGDGGVDNSKPVRQGPSGQVSPDRDL